MSELRSKLIRLAHQKPELREHLLPLLTPSTVQTRSAALGDPDRESFKRQVERYPGSAHYINHNGSDVEAFWIESPNARIQGTGAMFAGKSQIATSYFSYRDQAKFLRDLDQLAAQRKEYLVQKTKLNQDRREYKHDYVVGDILVGSWGYDQTNVDFYQVTETAGKQITLRAIDSRVVKSDGPAEYVVAVPNRFTGPLLRKIVQQGGLVKIDSTVRVRKWDGKPRYQTAFGYGH